MPWQPLQEALPSTTTQPAKHKRKPLSKVANMKLQQAAHKAGHAKGYVSILAPPLTHARIKQADAPTVSSMSLQPAQHAEKGFEHGETMSDPQNYDPFIHHRYIPFQVSGGGICKFMGISVITHTCWNVILMLPRDHLKRFGMRHMHSSQGL